jgi:hypothetical protein
LYEIIACIRAVKRSTCNKPVYSASIYHHHDDDDDDDDENILLYSQKFSNAQFGYSGKL